MNANFLRAAGAERNRLVWQGTGWQREGEQSNQVTEAQVSDSHHDSLDSLAEICCNIQP